MVAPGPASFCPCPWTFCRIQASVPTPGPLVCATPQYEAKQSQTAATTSSEYVLAKCTCGESERQPELATMYSNVRNSYRKASRGENWKFPY